MEVIRANTWRAIAASAVAAVTSYPSTAALFTVWNGESQALDSATGLPLGKSLVVDSIFGVQISAPASAFQWGILAMLSQGAGVVPGTPGPVPVSPFCRGTYPGKVVTMAAEGSLTDEGWFPIGGNSYSAFAAGSLPGTQILVPSRIVVPPGHRLHLSALANSTSVTVRLGLEWHEEAVTARF